MYRIRKANKADQKDIQRLIRMVGINPTGLKWQRFILTVDEDDNLIGCAQMKPHRDGSIELASVAVNPAYQGQKIASQMIEHLLQRQTQNVFLTCRKSMTGFYDQFAFSELLDLASMPSYFRRVKKLFNWLQKIFPKLEELSVMVRQA